MRWRLRFWFLRRDKNGKPAEPCPIDREKHSVDHIAYVFHAHEDGARKVAVEKAGPGSTVEIRSAPACSICRTERIGLTERDLQKQGWGGNGDQMTCKSCGGTKGDPEPRRADATTIIQLCDLGGGPMPCHVCKTAKPSARRFRREDQAVLIEQLKHRVDVLTKRLERLKQKQPVVQKTRPYQWPVRASTDQPPAVSEHTLDISRGINLKNGDE